MENQNNLVQTDTGILLEAGQSECFFGEHLKFKYNYPIISENNVFDIKVRQNLPKIPKVMWEAIVSLFHDLCSHNMEVAVRIMLSPLGDLTCIVPHQTVSGSHYTADYERCVNILTGERLKYTDMVCAGHDQLWQIHSHNTMQLSTASSVDDGNEKDPNELYMPGGYGILSCFGHYKQPIHPYHGLYQTHYYQPTVAAVPKAPVAENPNKGKDSYQVRFSIVSESGQLRREKSRYQRYYVGYGEHNLIVEDLPSDQHIIYDRDHLMAYHLNVVMLIETDVTSVVYNYGSQDRRSKLPGTKVKATTASSIEAKKETKLVLGDTDSGKALDTEPIRDVDISEYIPVNRSNKPKNSYFDNLDDEILYLVTTYGLLACKKVLDMYIENSISIADKKEREFDDVNLDPNDPFYFDDEGLSYFDKDGFYIQ